MCSSNVNFDRTSSGQTNRLLKIVFLLTHKFRTTESSKTLFVPFSYQMICWSSSVKTTNIRISVLPYPLQTLGFAIVSNDCFLTKKVLLRIMTVSFKNFVQTLTTLNYHAVIHFRDAWHFEFPEMKSLSSCDFRSVFLYTQENVCSGLRIFFRPHKSIRHVLSEVSFIFVICFS